MGEVLSPLYQYDAFLSHHSGDVDRNRALRDRLAAEGVRVWMCEEQGVGQTVQGLIEEGLKRCRYILVGVTPRAMESPWVKDEMDYAHSCEMEEGPTRLILVLLERTDTLSLPPLLRARIRVDPEDPAQLTGLARQLREPNLLEYREECRRSAVVSGVRFNGSYRVEPSDFLRVELDLLGPDPGAGMALRGRERIRLEDFRKEFTDPRKTPPAQVAVLLGEAGVGKTTTCKHLCRELASGWARRGLMPVYLPLADLRPDEAPETFLDRQVGVMPFERLDRDVGLADGRLFLFVDGWNEVRPGGWDGLRARIRQLAVQGRARVVVTSRPVASAEEVWPGDSACFFEVCRWTREQTRAYFDSHGRGALLDRVPDELRDCLRLPLLAVLLLGVWRARPREPALRTVGDVFGRVVDQALRGKGPAGPAGSAAPAERCLEELALRMTRDRTVTADGRSMERCLPGKQRSQFGPLLARLVVSGLLRLADGRSVLDPAAAAEELRGVRVCFLHQSLQEYLTARRCLRRPAVALPPDISHDAFWREVPVYMIQARDDPAWQAGFVRQFLDAASPDYATAARLVGEVSDPSARRQVEASLLGRLRVDLEGLRLYPYAIETFQRLGGPGRDALRKCLEPVELLSQVYARSESHLVGRTADGAREEAWRRMGRSIYLLGELGDLWLAGHLEPLLPSVASLHLLYHVGEALLTLARAPGGTAPERASIAEAARRLRQLQVHDEVTGGYAAAVLRHFGAPPADLRQQALRLGSFLREHAQTAGPHFRDEFWRRAHGAEAFAELAGPSECVDALARLFETEEAADYGEHPDGDFRQVQSSILKAALRTCELHPGTRAGWRGFLERVFESRRVADNGWACRHLERLLLRWFTTADDLEWLSQWRDSGGLGGEPLCRVLSNVLWLQRG